MKVKIFKSRAEGVVSAPPSKSTAHRYIICGGLQTGVTRIKNVALSEDIKATLRAIKALGAEYTLFEDTLEITGKRRCKDAVIDCGESGSTLRFFIPIALCLCEKVKFIGSKRLFERPLTVYEEIFKDNGIKYVKGENFLEVAGTFKTTEFTVDGSISSQFISGLLFALPLMGGGKIILKNRLESTPYTDMTLEAMRKFGINATKTDYGFAVFSTEYRGCNVTVEGDYSNAAFLEAFNCIGGNVAVGGLSDNSLQGDKAYRRFFKQLTAEFSTIDITDCPDLGPVLFAVAAANNGAKFTGTRRLRIKESDRASAMKEELEKFGISVTVGDNCVEIHGEPQKPCEILSAHNDHRIAMALSVLCSVTDGTVDGAECVAKSFPDFFEVIKTVGIDYEIKQ